MGKKKRAVVSLGGRKGKCLEVRVAGSDESYLIPLASNLPIGDAMAISELEGLEGDALGRATVRFFHTMACRCMPRDVVDSLSMEDFNALIEAWGEASGIAEEGLGE